MEKTQYQLIVIGSGPGGYVAAIRAAQLGFKVACVEKMKTLGGTCLNIGCIPSKALLQSTENYEWVVKSAKEQGINAAEVSFDLTVMMQRKEAIVKGLVEGISTLFKRHHIDRIEGEAHFLDPHTIEVVNNLQKTAISADKIIIATGSKPIALPFLPFDEKRIVSSTGALTLQSIPKRFIVIGGGAIGVELASVYRRLGSQVTIIEMLEEITPAMDSTIRKQLLSVLKKQGIEFYLGAKVKSGEYKDKNKECALTFEYEQKEHLLAAEIILVAVGRRPYTKGLDLEKVGIGTNEKGFISVDSNFNTTLSHVYAIGDVIEGPMLAHRATHEGMAVVEHLAGLKSYVNYISIPNVIYTHPEVASVGLTEEEAKAANLDLLIGSAFFRGNARARCSGDIEGMVKVIGEKRSGKLIGMHIINAHASELIAEGMIALDKQATLHELAEACHAHPTLSEAIMEASQQALGFAIHG